MPRPRRRSPVRTDSQTEHNLVPEMGGVKRPPRSPGSGPACHPGCRPACRPGSREPPPRRPRAALSLTAVRDTEEFQGRWVPGEIVAPGRALAEIPSTPSRHAGHSDRAGRARRGADVEPTSVSARLDRPRVLRPHHRQECRAVAHHGRAESGPGAARRRSARQRSGPGSCSAAHGVRVVRFGKGWSGPGAAPCGSSRRG